MFCNYRTRIITLIMTLCIAFTSVVSAEIQSKASATESGETIIYQENGINVVWRGIVLDGNYYKVNLFISNDTEETIQVV